MYLYLDLAFSSSCTTSIPAVIILWILGLYEHGALSGKSLAKNTVGHVHQVTDVIPGFKSKFLCHIALMGIKVSFTMRTVVMETAVTQEKPRIIVAQVSFV